MNIDFSKIPYFLAAAEYLSFTEAANHCYVTQSSLSRYIASLESDIGYPLFIRGNRKIYLTAEGTYLYNELSKYTADATRAFQRASMIRAGEKGSFSIFSSGYLPENRKFKNITSQFFKENPMFSCSISHKSYPDLRTHLMDGTSDAVLTGSPNIILIRNVNYITIATGEPFILCNPEFYPETEKPLTLSDFADARFLAAETSSFYVNHLNQWCDYYNIRPEIVSVHSIMDIIYYISNMNYATILNSIQYPVVNSELRVIPLEPVEDIQESKLTLAWKSNNSNPVLRHYVEYLQEKLNSGVKTLGSDSSE